MIEAGSDLDLELKTFIISGLVFIGLGNLLAIIQSEKQHTLTTVQIFLHFILKSAATYYGVSYGLSVDET